MGGMSGGHYTAYGQNFKNKKWYLFDDVDVQEVQEADVVTDKAYVLFYKRRDAPVLNVYQYPQDLEKAKDPLKHKIELPELAADDQPQYQYEDAANAGGSVGGLGQAAVDGG